MKIKMHYKILLLLYVLFLVFSGFTSQTTAIFYDTEVVETMIKIEETEDEMNSTEEGKQIEDADDDNVTEKEMDQSKAGHEEDSMKEETKQEEKGSLEELASDTADSSHTSEEQNEEEKADVTD